LGHDEYPHADVGRLYTPKGKPNLGLHLRSGLSAPFFLQDPPASMFSFSVYLRDEDDPFSVQICATPGAFHIFERNRFYLSLELAGLVPFPDLSGPLADGFGRESASTAGDLKPRCA